MRLRAIHTKHCKYIQLRYSPGLEQLAVHIDKRNKGLETEIILYYLCVTETGPEKLNCLAQHCIRIIWQD